ncbi:hypothetical protein QTO34_017257, partial [Cnephaeus nilssonii]
MGGLGTEGTGGLGKQACGADGPPMYETKLKELETDIAKKAQSLTDLKQLVRQATKREQKVKKYTEDLEQQASNIEILKHIPEGAETKQGLQRELQILRLANSKLEKEKEELIHQTEVHKDQGGAESTLPEASGLRLTPARTTKRELVPCLRGTRLRKPPQSELPKAQHQCRPTPAIESESVELGACPLRHQAFRKHLAWRRLLKGLVHQQTGTQLPCDESES